MTTLLILSIPCLIIGLGLLWFLGIKPSMENRKVVREFYSD